MNLRLKEQPSLLWETCELQCGVCKAVHYKDNIYQLLPVVSAGMLSDHSNFYCSMENGKKIDTQDYGSMRELAYICSLCNDSSVDYNAVSRPDKHSLCSGFLYYPAASIMLPDAIHYQAR